MNFAYDSTSHINNLPIYLTVDESAEYLRVTPKAIRNMIYRGEIPVSRLGKRRVRILKNDLNKLLKKLF